MAVIIKVFHFHYEFNSIFAFVGNWSIWTSDDRTLQSSVLCGEWQAYQVRVHIRQIRTKHTVTMLFIVMVMYKSDFSLFLVQRSYGKVLLLLASAEASVAIPVCAARGGLFPSSCICSAGWPGKFQTEQALWFLLSTWGLLPFLGEHWVSYAIHIYFVPR